MFGASVAGPDGHILVHEIQFPEPPRGPRLECQHDIFRRRWRGHDDVYVIRSHVQCMNSPTPMLGYALDRPLHGLTLLAIQNYRRLTQALLRGMPATAMWLQHWRTIGVVLEVGRSALVPVQPGAVGAERDQVSDRIGHG